MAADPELAAKLNANPGYQSALQDAESESWDGPGIDGTAMIGAADERRRGRGGAGVAAETAKRKIAVNVTGTEVTVEVREGWTTIAPVTTAARWLAGCGALPFDDFETRDDAGVLLIPDAALGDWLDGRTLHVNRLAGIGARLHGR